MRTIIYILILLSFTSCSTQGFYSKLKSHSNIYEDFLKHKFNKKILTYLEKDLISTDKIIFIGTLEEFYSYRIIYDDTNKVSHYIEKYKFDKYPKYYRDPLTKKENHKFSTLIFALDYVLNNKMEELESISKEAYHYTTDTEFITIRVIDVSAKTYKKYVVGSFEVYNGKPIMTEEEYWSIDWSQFQD